MLTYDIRISILLTRINIYVYYFYISGCITGPRGISHCKGQADGDYQYCNGCGNYVTCIGGHMVTMT